MLATQHLAKVDGIFACDWKMENKKYCCLFSKLYFKSSLKLILRFCIPIL